MPDDTEVIALGRSRAVRDDFDGDERRLAADLSHDPDGPVLLEGADDRAGIGHLERGTETGHDRDDLRLRHREADLADVEKRVTEGIDVVAVDMRDGAGRGDGEVTVEQHRADGIARGEWLDVLGYGCGRGRRRSGGRSHRDGHEAHGVEVLAEALDGLG